MSDLTNLGPIEIDATFSMASCTECGPPALPFGDPAEREKWVMAHVKATGHHVSVSIKIRGHVTTCADGSGAST